RVQECLFHEKQTIIENCLFGVDINPNSVKICRLRLWIELLKNAYYKYPDYTELETLPNIDINIKCGNSLISRYALDADIKILLKTSKWSINTYRIAVATYRNAKSKEEKRELEALILQIKQEFTAGIRQNDPTKTRLDKLANELYNRFTGNFLFEPDVVYGKNGEELEKKRKKEQAKLEKEVSELSKKMEDIRNNKIYENSFEWRFEFPEVLNDDGDFVGFDIVIGNPPYIPLESFNEVERVYFKGKYIQLERKYETSVPFILEGINLLNINGLLSYIAPITWQTGENYSKFRNYLLRNNGIDKIINLPFNIFEDAYVDTALYFLLKHKYDKYSIFAFDKKAKPNNLNNISFSIINISDLKEPDLKLVIDKNLQQFSRFDNDRFISLGQITKSTQGLSGSNFLESLTDDEFTFPFLEKGNVYNYTLLKEKIYLTELSTKKNLIGFYKNEPKILIRRIINRQNRLSVAYCEEKLVFKKDINPFIPTDSNFDAKYLTAILASKFISFIYLNSSTIATKDDFRQTTLSELRKLPIPIATYNLQNNIIRIVDNILALKLDDYKTNTTSLESEIDQLVYQLYGLSEEEIRIVEGK
ncbi:MAG: Eco57I restriction-modification methylase domain-containing protein, partial [Bacteroidales bacterium]